MNTTEETVEIRDPFTGKVFKTVKRKPEPGEWEPGMKIPEDPDKIQIGGDHYKKLGVQPWDAMESWLSHSEFKGFLLGNAIKYLARAGKKGDALEDLRKARHYLDKLISLLESSTNQSSFK